MFHVRRKKEAEEEKNKKEKGERKKEGKEKGRKKERRARSRFSVICGEVCICGWVAAMSLAPHCLTLMNTMGNVVHGMTRTLWATRFS